VVNPKHRLRRRLLHELLPLSCEMLVLVLQERLLLHLLHMRHVRHVLRRLLILLALICTIILRVACALLKMPSSLAEGVDTTQRLRPRLGHVRAALSGRLFVKACRRHHVRLRSHRLLVLGEARAERRRAGRDIVAAEALRKGRTGRVALVLLVLLLLHPAHLGRLVLLLLIVVSRPQGRLHVLPLALDERFGGELARVRRLRRA